MQTSSKTSYEGTSGLYRAIDDALPVKEFGTGKERLIIAYTFRAHRIFTRRFAVPGLVPTNNVMVSLCEIGRSSNAGPLDTPFVGDATMKVYNVAASNGEVVVRGEIDWDDDIDIRIAIFVA
jgi:hypothetical protein